MQQFLKLLLYSKKSKTKFNEVVECIDMSYISFFVNQHVGALKVATECENDKESMEKIAEVLEISQPGYYIIFEMCDDTTHEVSILEPSIFIIQT